MIVLNEKLKRVLYWALTVTVILASFEAIFSIVALTGFVTTNYKLIDMNHGVSAYGYIVALINYTSTAVISVLYIVFLFRSLHGLKQDNFFNLRNAYMLVCIAGVGLLASVMRNVSASFTGIMHIIVVIPTFLSSIAPSAFMMCIALLYLAAVRSEESERLTI